MVVTGNSCIKTRNNLELVPELDVLRIVRALPLCGSCHYSDLGVKEGIGVQPKLHTNTKHYDVKRDTNQDFL